ncbi:MAG: DNA-processing protein DprA [bacterium]
MKNNQQALLHMSLISGIGPATVFKLIEHICAQKHHQVFDFEISKLDDVLFSELYQYSKNDFKSCGLSENLSHVLWQGLNDTALLEQEIKLIEKYAIRIDTILDSSYPELLRHIHQPPLVLYSKGQAFEEHAKRIAFVGSRKADEYAQQVITALVSPLVDNGWEIVSGGARGADSFAHQAALDGKGKTTVVLGSGLLNPYPELNKELFRTVFKNNGTLVSSFPLQTHPDKKTFPARNRIIAGLAQGTVIVQAAKKSGALITAQFALDQGRQVFAIPGSVFNELSYGCHALLAQGAKLVNNVYDILDEFGEKDISQHQNTQMPVEPNGVIAQVPQPCSLTQQEDPLLVFFQGVVTIDELSSSSGLCLAELQDKLFTLELEGKVKQNFVGSWEKN